MLQLVKANLALKGGKIQVIAQNGELKSRQHRVRSGMDLLPDHVQPGHHEGVGVDLLLAEAVQIQAVVFMEQLSRPGAEPGAAHIPGSLQVHPQQVPDKVHGLLLGTQGPGQLRVALQVAQQAFGIDGYAHTFSFMTIFLKAWGWSRWMPGIWASSGKTT